MLDADLTSIFAGVASSIFTTGIFYGVMKTKVERLERDVERNLREQKTYVPIDLFHATINPIRQDLHEMQRDIKKILTAVQKPIS